MTGIVREVGEAVKRVFKGVKKVFKKVTDSTVGKVLLAGAAVFLTGGAMGWWKTGFKAIDGAIAGAGSGASSAAAQNAAIDASMKSAVSDVGAKVAASTAGGGSGTLASAAGQTATTSAGGMTITGTQAASQGLAGAEIAKGASTIAAAGSMNPAQDIPDFSEPQRSAARTVREGVNQAVSETAAEGAAKEGIVSRMMNDPLGTAWDGVRGAANWIGDHPFVSTMALNGAARAMSERERRQLMEDERERRNRNYDVSGLDLGFRPTGDPLRRPGGGLVFSNMG